MPSWHINLTSRSGKPPVTYIQNIDQDTHATIFIDGDTADPDTWRFVEYSEETQARCDWISQFSKFTHTHQSLACVSQTL
jgi:hypothetical protein